MPLAAGARLGVYEVLTPLGAGGMGEVYKARDTRLNRTVAIKILPPHIGNDSQLRQRFRREAETIASISHPHVCVLHDIGESDGVEFLVMEHLEGATLADRLRRGPMKTEELVQRAREIAQGLHAAHRLGIVHRDLKPQNIVLTPGGAKILDFGLAKLHSTEPQPIAGATRSVHELTNSGMLLGTVPYMSPEQLQGKEADARSDIFAFGAILYEMCAGRRAFAGESPASIIAAVIEREPDASALDANVPTVLRRIVLTCLAKNPEDRWQSAADIARALEWAQTGDTATRTSSRRRRATLVMLLAGFVAVAGTLAVLNALWRRAPQSPLYASITPPPGLYFTSIDASTAPLFALAPDGRRIAFAAAARGEWPRLWVRALDSPTAQPLSGTDGARAVFWSPDGQHLGFFVRGRLKRIPAAGGTVQELAANASIDTNGGSWSARGIILFGAGSGDGLYRVPEEGGTAEPATRVDTANGESGHRWPQILPDGSSFLFYVRSTRPGRSGVYFGSLNSDSKILVLPGATTAVYVEPGFLLFERAGALMFQPFDAATGKLTGQAAPVGDQISPLLGPSLLPLSATANGTLAYWNGQEFPTEFAWVHRSGRPLGSIASDANWVNPMLAPDGRRLLASRRAGTVGARDLFLIDLVSGVETRLSFSGVRGRTGVWSPDSQEVIFTAREDDLWKIYRRTLAGASSELPLELSARQWTTIGTDWSRDRRWLVFHVSGATNGWDIMVADLTTMKETPLIDAPGNQVQGRLSPDGRWLAYASDELGEWQVYIQPFGRKGDRWQVSRRGGLEPSWRGDGRELFYMNLDGSLAAVPVDTAGGFTLGAEQTLFRTRIQPDLAPYWSTYAVTSDGEKFIVNNPAEHWASVIQLLRNWRGN